MKGERESLRERSVLLVGATGALGRELASLLAERGCRLALVARDGQRLRALQSRLSAKAATIWPCDVASARAVADTYSGIVEGAGPVEVAIFASGVGRPMEARSFSAAEFEHVLRVNLLSLGYWLDGLLPDFRRRLAGTIIGVSSLAAGRGLPAGLAYCPSKAGVSVLFECLRTDLAPLGIRVHLVEPGFFRSEMTRRLPYTPFLIPARQAAETLIRGVERGKARIRFPGNARLYAAALRGAPIALFDRLMGLGHPARRQPDLDSRAGGRENAEATGELL